ncbi:MAG: dodecin [Anaerolineales bacterium]
MDAHIYKTVEITGTSSDSIDDAVRKAVEKASLTVRQLRWFEVVEVRGVIEEQRVSQWQVTTKLGFTLD